MKKLVGSLLLVCTLQAGSLAVSNVASAQQAPVDCPVSLHCDFVPAAHAAPDPKSPAVYGNYDVANRPHDVKIDSIVIHDTESSYASTINGFQDPTYDASANYVVQPSGQVTEMVRPNDVSWGAGNWYMNIHAINIEHVGVAANPDSYTEAMYRSSAKLVRYLAERYRIVLDRAHIVGHEEVPVEKSPRVPDAHTDPGPYWNWSHYMALVSGGDATGVAVRARDLHAGQAVMVNPAYETNDVPFNQCDAANVCSRLASHGTSVVRLHAGPSDSAALVSETHLHPDGSAGTEAIGDWSSTAVTGQQLVVAKISGSWIGIWFGGGIGWIDDSRPVLTPVVHRVVRPVPGRQVAVYGAAFPEASKFPKDVRARSADPLYEISGDQSYVTSDTVRSDDLIVTTVDSSAPDDGTVVRGDDEYYRIWFNHRIGYVKTTDAVICQS